MSYHHIRSPATSSFRFQPLQNSSPIWAAAASTKSHPPTFVEQFYTENLLYAPPPTTHPQSKLPNHHTNIKFYSMKSNNTSGAAHPRFNNCAQSSRSMPQIRTNWCIKEMEQPLQKRVVKNKVVPVHPPSHPTNVLQALHYFPKQKYCCCCSTTGTVPLLCWRRLLRRIIITWRGTRDECAASSNDSRSDNCCIIDPLLVEGLFVSLFCSWDTVWLLLFVVWSCRQCRWWYFYNRWRKLPNVSRTELNVDRLLLFRDGMLMVVVLSIARVSGQFQFELRRVSTAPAPKVLISIEGVC